MTITRFIRKIFTYGLVPVILLSGCATTTTTPSKENKRISSPHTPITYVKHERKREPATLAPCITGRRFDVMIDLMSPVNRDDLAVWLDNMIESLPEDRELPLFIMTARPYGIPAGVENPQSAAIGRIFQKIPQTGSTEPLQRAFQEYRRTYLCERNAEGTLVVFSNIQGLSQRINNQGLLSQMQRLLTENPNVKIVWVVAHPAKADWEYLLSLQEKLTENVRSRYFTFRTDQWRSGQIDPQIISILLGNEG